jgi:hypothetical protein
MFDQYHCRSPKMKYPLAAKDARKKKRHPRALMRIVRLGWHLNTRRLRYAILIKPEKYYTIHWILAFRLQPQQQHQGHDPGFAGLIVRASAPLRNR